jgi:aminomethyltransferase
VSDSEPIPLRRTVLYDLHRRAGGRFGPFAGWEMPIRYAAGPVAEHVQCRSSAALFDVSHMTVVDLHGTAVLDGLGALVPADLRAAEPARATYSFFTDDDGGILDDVMITKVADDAVRLVLNAATTEADLAYLGERLPSGVTVQARRDLALVALQGPASEAVLERLGAAVAGLSFLQAATVTVSGRPVELSRSGYTGGDGFELALPAGSAEALAEEILADPAVEPAGLAARDSLRLEAGLCLYGHDLDPSVTPVEAGLQWAVPVSRRHPDAGWRGAAAVARQLADGPSRRRVGLRPLGRRPVREGATLTHEAADVGVVTSGGYSPVLAAPIAMGYVRADLARPGTELDVRTGERSEPCQVVALPFVAKQYRH